MSQLQAIGRVSRADKGRILITDRDQKLCRYLFENKIATAEQINRDVLGNVAFQTSYRRLKKLAGTGLVTKIPCTSKGKPSHAYSAGKMAVASGIVEQTEGLRLQTLSDSVEHDLVLNDIRSCISGYAVVRNYFTENLIESGEDFELDEHLHSIKHAHPDAILQICLDDSETHYVPLEYEATLKSKERSKRKLDNYYLRPDVEALLFVSKDSAIEERFRALDGEISTRAESKVFFTQLANVLSRGKKLTFSNLKGKTITLR